MRDHWQRTSSLWPPGAMRDTWLVTFDDLPSVRALAAAAARSLDRPSLDVVPLEWLHLTLEAPPAGHVTATFLPPVAVDEGVVVNVTGTEELGPWPHVSLAYSNADDDPPDLSGLATVPVTTTITSVARVRLRRTRGLYSWDVLGRVPLRDSK